MANDGRVVTANIPEDLAKRLDLVAERIDRSKSWIVKQALSEWLTEEERRHDMTLDAIASLDDGRSFSQQEIERHYEDRQRQRLAATEQKKEQGGRLQDKS